MRIQLWWCRNCNIPIREPKCSKCGDNGEVVSQTDPGDIRPAFRGDLEFISKALYNEFNDLSIEKILKIEEGRVYLNRIPFIDDMKEVVVGGVVVGRLFFDIKNMDWRWRLSESSAQLLVDHGKIEYVVRDRVKPLEIVKQGGPEGSQIPVVNSSGKLSALAISRSNSYRIQKIFKKDPKLPLENPKATLSDVVKGNEYRLRRLTSLAASKTYSISRKIGKPLVVSYSGGKDSLVALSVVLKTGLEPRVLFNDTGLELSETTRNIKDVSKFFNLELDYVYSGDFFWRALELFGPPARDYRWCCKVVKLAPIARYYRKNYPNGALVVVGQRAYESLQRFKSGYLWRNKWLPQVLNMSPIQEWDQLSEWLYILKHKLPYNSLYTEGFDRLGCYLCPAANIAEYCLVEKLHPDLWSTWTREILRWQKLTAQPVEWSKYHLWRWLKKDSPGRQRICRYLRIADISEGTPTDTSTPTRGSRLGITMRVSADTITLESALYSLVEPVIQQRTILGLNTSTAKADGSITLTKTGKRSNTEVLLYERRAIVVGEDSIYIAYDIVKLTSRWYVCVRCGNCLFWCPSKAISISRDRLKVDLSRCRSCRVCLEVCPISSIYVDKIERYKLGYPFKLRKRVDVELVLELYREIGLKNSTTTSNNEILNNLEGLNFFLELE
ncbi:MAG: phosphoadenosine phosphosulfate reductase family protein [Sulfolobales archaeon]|nr:phosphoadenosine phosphosulfate reductase family protein [Sulfolobales archaeon]MDW8083289.1 phosphoadenosine phosphosulfate reductase family protein [Sulfolobales archaeon]